VEMNSPETPRQRAHHVSDPLIIIDCVAEVAKLRSGEAYTTADHAAHTITKQSGMRVVLIALKAGGEMNEHHADAPITLHGLQGCVNLTVGDQTVRLTPGLLVTVAQGLPHRLEAIDESAFLLTIGGGTASSDAAS
jgi:quercetin dioxygenase-like cupin family protein